MLASLATIMKEKTALVTSMVYFAPTLVLFWFFSIVFFLCGVVVLVFGGYIVVWFLFLFLVLCGLFFSAVVCFFFLPYFVGFQLFGLIVAQEGQNI